MCQNALLYVLSSPHHRQLAILGSCNKLWTRPAPLHFRLKLHDVVYCGADDCNNLPWLIKKDIVSVLRMKSCFLDFDFGIRKIHVS